MSMSNDTVYAPADIEVLPRNDREMSLTNSIIDITPCESTTIPVRKKEYSIVGDSFYAAINDGPTPTWLDEILDDVIDSLLTDHLSEITDANKNLLDAIFALDVAHNDYTEMIHIDVRVDQAISAHLTTLNSRLDDNDATIIHLDMNKVTPEMAAAISIDAISSSLDNGAISGRLASIDYSVSTLAGNVTGVTDLLESRYGELNSAIVDFTIETGASLDKVYSSFKYDSILKVGDDRFRSGFGLNSEVKIPVPGEPGVYDSEFWIDAQRLKFTNSNQTGSVSPFTIDASGPTPEVTFNGKVSFSNVADVPQLGSSPSEVVDAINNGSTTTIDGGRITTGSITADQIKANSITGDQIEAGTITANEINAENLSVNAANITGTLDYNKIRTNGNLLTERINSVKSYNFRSERLLDYSYTSKSANAFFGMPEFTPVNTGDALVYSVGNFGETGRIVISGTVNNSVQLGEVYVSNSKLFFSVTSNLSVIIRNSSGNNVDGGVISRRSGRFTAKTGEKTGDHDVPVTSDSILIGDVSTGDNYVRLRDFTLDHEIPFSITLECPNLVSGTIEVSGITTYYATLENQTLGSMSFHVRKSSTHHPMQGSVWVRNLSIIAHRV